MPSTILVVEDEVLVARDITARLSRMGYDVIGDAARGEDAVALALEEKPDLILMDINLRGDMDGIEAAMKIGEAASIPIIFCTAYSNDEILKRAKVTSPYGYVLKPFDNRELEINIEIALFKHKVEKDLAQTKSNLDATLSNISDGVIATGLDGEIVFVNPVAESIIGCPPDSNNGKNVQDVLLLEEFDAGKGTINLIEKSSITLWQIRQYVVRSDGRRIPVEVSISYQDSDSSLTVITFRDISQQLGYEETIQKNAFFDSLTELPNRSLFVDRLSGSMNRRKRGGERGKFAVLFIGLDGFSVINEGFGHDFGDQVINEIGQRIVKSIRPDDTLSRFSGDVFAVLLDPVDEASGAIQACQRILDNVRAPFELGDTTLNISASAGIMVDNGQHFSADEMLRDADTALNRAKSDAQGSYVVFDSAMYQDAVRFIDRKNGIQKAMLESAFKVYYQPIVALETGKLVSMEALVRWPHPEEGMISPSEFIPIAEATGLIIPLGEYILREACNQIRAWKKMGLNGFRVAVNFSARQFETDVSSLVKEVMCAAEIEPTTLALEITEGLAMKNVNHNTQMLDDLRKLGVHISMDDFGTGYSSLSYLKRFPLTTLKIDQSFVRDIEHDQDDQEITKAIVAMGQSLGLATLAEGVENEKQLEILREYGCDYIQGYYFSEPLPASEMTDYLLNALA